MCFLHHSNVTIGEDDPDPGREVQENEVVVETGPGGPGAEIEEDREAEIDVDLAHVQGIDDDHEVPGGEGQEAETEEGVDQKAEKDAGIFPLYQKPVSSSNINTK